MSIACRDINDSPLPEPEVPSEGCYRVGDEAWATLAEAATAAAPGATIALCGGASDEVLTFTRDVTLVGDPEAMTRWVSPDSRPVVRVSAAKVTLVDVALEAPSVAAVVEGGSLTLTRSAVSSQDLGIVGREAEIVLDGTTLHTGGTAIWLQGGTGMFAGGGLRAGVAPAVRVDGAAAELHETTLTSGPGGPAVEVVGGSIGLFDVHASPADALVDAIDAAVSVHMLHASGAHGLVIQGGSADLSQVDLTVSALGVELVDTTRATLTDVTVRSDGTPGSWGLVATDADLSWTGGAVVGHGGGGASFTAGGADVVARLTDVDITDNPAVGLRVRGGQLVAEDVDVSGTKGDARRCTNPEGDQRSCGFGVEVSDAVVTWTGGRVTENAIGLLATGADVTLHGPAFDLNDGGLWSRGGALSLIGGSVTRTTGVGVLLEEASWTVRDAVFEGNRAEREAADVGTPMRVSGAGIDIDAWASVGVLEDTRFTTGDRAIGLSGGEARLARVAVVGAHGPALDLRDGAAGWIDGFEVQDHAGVVVDCAASNLLGGGLSAANVAWGAVDTWTWTDGAWAGPTRTTAPEPAVRASACFLDLDGVTLRDLDAAGITLDRGLVSFTNLATWGAADRALTASNAAITVSGFASDSGVPWLIGGGRLTLHDAPGVTLSCDPPPELSCEACFCEP